ncbi:MAG: hypothetical protein AAF420_07600 [Pseudomonadota bacterium]
MNLADQAGRYSRFLFTLVPAIALILITLSIVVCSTIDSPGQ